MKNCGVYPPLFDNSEFIFHIDVINNIRFEPAHRHLKVNGLIQQTLLLLKYTVNVCWLFRLSLTENSIHNGHLSNNYDASHLYISQYS